ncbi:poly(glycerol-phosphate) alpha-glucosyltransferase [Levilactobacillus brevis]|uniref:glycosyltransferase n=1 Tax=Levilactobacillus brevis TaxID=1580 RepID=UPI0005B64EFE|nr:glycosyltransferase [Levilactobacillus brevis]KIR08586.1 poly(glycerol-phosphate) alpha-glucosyltransferase [Levilactobacillus brevis]
MNYFVDSDLGSAITGVEQAEFNRLTLFHRAGMPATIVYLTYKPRMQEFAKKFGVQGHSFTMYDYFQNATEYKDVEHYDWRNYWEKVCHYKLESIRGAYDLRIMDDDRFIMYASFLDGEYTRIKYINYFDKDHHKIRRDTYDCRGFLSRTTLLEEDDLTNTEIYYDPQQNVRLIKEYLVDHNKKKTYLRQVTIKGYNHREYYFASEEELRTFFFDQLFTQDDLVFVDRQSEMTRSIQNTNRNVKMIMIFHNTHVVAGDDVRIGRLKFGVYDYALAHTDRASAFVTATKQQKIDLKARYDNLPPIYTIPVSWATPLAITDQEFKDRNPHRIISIARYSRQKQLHHQVEAVERLVGEFPDIELHLLGYGETVGAELQKYITDHHLEQHVFLRGFQLDLTDDLRQGSLALQTSIEEGFSIASLEALSAGIPIIGYDINYGPKEMIVDGKNGFLIPANDKEMLYQKMRQYLGNKDLQLKMMRNCQPLVQKFSSTRMMEQWQQLVQDMRKS